MLIELPKQEDGRENQNRALVRANQSLIVEGGCYHDSGVLRFPTRSESNGKGTTRRWLSILMLALLAIVAFFAWRQFARK